MQNYTQKEYNIFLQKRIDEIKKDIIFKEKEHIYYIKGNSNYTSASSVSKRFTPKFNYYNILSATAEKRKVSTTQLKQEWDYKRDYSCALGNLTHNTISSFLNNTIFKPSNEFSILEYCDIQRVEKASQKALEWLNKENFYILGAEVMLYNELAKIVGTLDLLVEREGKYYIIDWKTNQKDIFNDHYNSYLLSPFNNLRNTTFNKYQIQLSVYKFLVETTLSIKIEDCLLVLPLLNNESNEIEVYKCNDYSNLIFKYKKNEEN